MHIALLILILCLSGCGSFKKTALRSVTPIFVDGAADLNQERNWDFFKEAMPANLKLYEILYLQDQDNLDLLGTLIKGYAGYSYGVAETLWYGDDLASKDESVHKKNAIALYTKTLDYGLSYFEKKGIKRKDLLQLDEKKLVKLLNSKFSEDDLIPVLYTGQAWGSLINLQKDNIALISHIPKVGIILDWVCRKDVNIEHGVCDLYYAQYEAARPKMLGGNPEKAKKLFEEAIKRRPHSLIVPVSYLQFSILPTFNSKEYERIAKDLRMEFEKWENINRDNLEDNSEYKNSKHLNLYNAIAKKRFEAMESNKDKILEGKTND